MSQLQINHLTFGYDKVPVLHQINLTVDSGELLVLLGPSGSGKSTLLRLLAGLETPDHGQILQNGEPVLGASRDRAIVFQDYSLFPWLTLQENVALALACADPGLNRPARLKKAAEQLTEVGLGDARQRYPFEVSGGMRQRAAIARALALDASVLLLDEPFGALDPVNRLRLQDLLHRLRQRHALAPTTIFVTHDLDEALWLGDRVAVLGASPGHLVGIYTPPRRGRENREVFRHQPEVRALREQIEDQLAVDVLRRLSAEEADQ